MKEHQLLSTGTVDILLVSLPEDSILHRINLSLNKIDYYLSYWRESKKDAEHLKLPPGNWKEVGWSDSLTFKQKFEILDKCHVAGPMWTYKMYDDSGYHTGYIDVSWASFLSANNITERVYILLKK